MSAALRIDAIRARNARIVLDPRGHNLFVDLGHVSRMFTRAQAAALNEALILTDADSALVLLSAFAPGVRTLEDVAALQRAVLAFDDEMQLEDQRTDERHFKASKAVPL